jgi:hypothetical protein
MKAAELREGGQYVAKVSNRLTVVRLDKIADRYDPFARRHYTRYYVTNTKTGRKTEFRSPTKFRREA